MLVQDSSEEYFANDSLNKSSIDLILECPALFAAKDQFKETDSKALRVGSLFHCMVLEHNRLNEAYQVLQYDGRTKAGKAERMACLEQGKIGVDRSEWDLCHLMAESVARSPFGNLFTLPGKSEVSVYWDEVVDGLPCPCKARVDRIANLSTYRLAVDLKSTQVLPNPNYIGKVVSDHHYHRQAAWYLRGLEKAGHPAAKFIFVFVSKQPPYLVQAVELSNDAIELGNEECEEAQDIYVHCRDAQEWPGYSNKIETIDLPPFCYK